MKCSDIIDDIYNYLGYQDVVRDKNIDRLSEELFQEVERLAQFKYIYKEMNRPLSFMEDDDVYLSFLDGCTSYLLVLTTLGKRIDDRYKYYSVIDPLKMCVFDAISNAYLERKADEYEKEHFKGTHTYRFCPGYQGTETKALQEMIEVLEGDKIGVTLKESMLMVPLKSMCGIIGLGIEKKKMCGACMLLGKCAYRKGGKRCY